MKTSKLKSRAKIINYFYHFELFNKPIDNIKAFESGDFSDKEMKIIENIATNYVKFKTLILKFNKTKWTWERINPYVRAVLIYGTFDFILHDKKLVINELIILTKAYAPDDSYKLVNGILNEVGKYYEKIKNNSQKTKQS